MSEDQELLARIGQLAGHINLHRAQPSPTQNSDPEKTRSHAAGPNTTRGNSNWRAARHAPYGGRGRGASRRYPTSHSLVLNRENPPLPATKSASSSEKFDGPEALHSTPAYVSKRGRHKQLINSSVLDKVMQQRKQAIEGSKQRKILLNDQRERKRMQQYLEALDAGQGSAIVQMPQTTSNTIHHIEINGLTFQILKNGSKLARKFGPTDMSLPTPKRMTVQGVVFVRSKHGNLYRSGMIRASKDVSGAQISSLCKRFTKTGHCGKGPACLYRHDPMAVAICPIYIQTGSCPAGDSCDLSHDATAERVPACLHFLRGKCSNSTCRYAHVRVNPSAPVCKSFATLGYCSEGAECTNRHVHECPDYANTGTCRKKHCGLPHIDRAGQIRKHAAQVAATNNTGNGIDATENAEGDISSDEDDGVDTDGEDIDSDDLADDLIEGVDALGRQALAEQHDFVGL